VDAETELHDPVCGEVVVPFRHQPLHRDGDSTAPTMLGNSSKKPVAGVLHDPAGRD